MSEAEAFRVFPHVFSKKNGHPQPSTLSAGFSGLLDSNNASNMGKLFPSPFCGNLPGSQFIYMEMNPLSSGHNHSKDWPASNKPNHMSNDSTDTGHFVKRILPLFENCHQPAIGSMLIDQHHKGLVCVQLYAI